MRYPELTDDQRQLLFDIVEASLEAGPGQGRMWVFVQQRRHSSEIYILIEGVLDKPTISKTSWGHYVALKVLEDATYLRIDPRHDGGKTMLINLTQLALDYFRWYQRPRAYKAISSRWASLSGEERGVIMALLVTLVISPLAGALFRLAQSLVESLLLR